MTKLPNHGRIDCQRCFSSCRKVEFDVTKRTENDWRITANPLAWGNVEPEIVVLGFSKGPTQAGALATQPHDEIAYKGSRLNVGKILAYLGLLPVRPGEDLASATSRIIADTAGRFHFGSLVRCTVERKDTDGWKGSGGGMLDKFIATPFGREVTSNCAKLYLGSLPASVKLVIMFGMGSALNYVDEAFNLLSVVRQRPWRRLNEVAYTDGEVVVVHVEHFASQGALVRNWLGENEHSRSRYGMMACDAVKLAVSVCKTPAAAPDVNSVAVDRHATIASPQTAAPFLVKDAADSKDGMTGDEDIELILGVIEQAGYSIGKNSKYLGESISPSGHALYLMKRTSILNRIVFCADPRLDPERLRKLDGVDSVGNKPMYHSNMSRFPKRLNSGAVEITYGWKVSIAQLSDVSRFLKAFEFACF